MFNILEGEEKTITSCYFREKEIEDFVFIITKSYYDNYPSEVLRQYRLQFQKHCSRYNVGVEMIDKVLADDSPLIKITIKFKKHVFINY